MSGILKPISRKWDSISQLYVQFAILPPLARDTPFKLLTRISFRYRQQRRIIWVAISVVVSIILAFVAFEVVHVFLGTFLFVEVFLQTEADFSISCVFFPPVGLPPSKPNAIGTGSIVLEYLQQGWINATQASDSAVFKFNITNSFFGVVSLNQSQHTYSGMDAPHIGDVFDTNDATVETIDASKFAVMPATSLAIEFVFNVPACHGLPIVATVNDIIEIYAGKLLLWSDLYRRHPEYNGCLVNVSQTQQIYALIPTHMGMAYYLQTIFHTYNSTLWPTGASLEWQGPNCTWTCPLLESIHDMNLAYIYTQYSIGVSLANAYFPLASQDVISILSNITLPTSTVSDNVAIVQNVARSVGASQATLSPASPPSVLTPMTFSNWKVLNLTTDTTTKAASKLDCFNVGDLAKNCPDCWPFMLCGFVVVPTNIIVPAAQATDPTIQQSCLNIQAVLRLIQQALQLPFPAFPLASIGVPSFFPLNTVNQKQVLSIVSHVTCNHQYALSYNYFSSTLRRNIIIEVFVFLAVFVICLAISIYFAVIRQERSNRDQINKLNALGSLDLDTLLLEDYSDMDSLVEMQTKERNSMPKKGSNNSKGSANSFGAQSNGSSSLSTASSSSGSMGTSGSSKSKSSAKDEALERIMISVNDVLIGSLIGTGSYGEVYTGMYKHKLVAVKRLASSSDPEKTKSFLQEVRAMTDLDHPNILRLIAIAYNPPYTYILTEYCKFGSLEDFLKNHTDKISTTQKLNLILGAARGMHYLHSKDIAHRDLKLSNLLVTESRTVKVGDLGTATDSLGEMKTRVGTVEYCAPEVLDGQAYTKSCDVYSFGLCLWCLFSEKPLFPGWSLYDIITKVVGGARPPLDAINSPRLAKLIQTCWSPQPTARPTFEQIIMALSDIDQSDFRPR